jgi:hypothetical protein
MGSIMPGIWCNSEHALYGTNTRNYNYLESYAHQLKFQVPGTYQAREGYDYGSVIGD